MKNKKTKCTLYELCEVQARMFSINQAHLQYKCKVDHQVVFFWGGGGGTTKKYSPMNKASILLIDQVKMVSNLWQAAKIN